jgi:hypothetical protein
MKKKKENPPNNKRKNKKQENGNLLVCVYVVRKENKKRGSMHRLHKGSILTVLPYIYICERKKQLAIQILQYTRLCVPPAE